MGDGAGPLALLDLHRTLSAASVRARLQYRLSFAADTLAVLLSTFVDFLAILVIFSHLHALGGWTLFQVGLLYGAASISFGVTDLVMGHLDSFSDWVREGRFDVLLTRPVGTLFQLITSDFQPRRIGKIAQAAAILVVSLLHLHVSWSVPRAAMLAAMLVSGIAIYSGVWIAGASIAFWTTEIREVMNAFTYGGNFLASYPVNIFEEWMRRFLAFVVPIAFVSYYPSLFILGKPDPLGGPSWLPLLTPIVGLGTLLLGGRIWGLGVRHYRSTGS